MMSSKPVTAPLQAEARPKQAAGDISANACRPRINNCRLRKMRWLAPILAEAIQMPRPCCFTGRDR